MHSEFEVQVKVNMLPLNWKRMVAKGISSLYRLPNVINKHKIDNRILMYHSLGDRVIRDPSNIYSVNEDLFKKQMRYLKREYSERVSELSLKTLENEKSSIVITFDDGYKDNLYIASPLLEELEMPYTVFVSTGYIKNNNNNFLSESELRELSDMPGASIGSHGVTHASLTQCSDKDLKNELLDSKHYIEDVIGKKIDKIAYPSGAVDQRVVDATRLAGYQLGGTSYNNRNSVNSDNLFLARTCIFGIDSMSAFKQKVRGDWDWLKHIQKPQKITL
jgi:peptidoglycan/xylan/chitin deacetylase (PgdA/CDA1 family)